jgi:DNA-binding transcriptional ArsR family regulator
MRKPETSEQAIEQTFIEFKELSEVFQNLADENRQRILAILGKSNALNVTQISAEMALSRPAVSHHLKRLKQSGLVDCKKEGKEHYYFLTLKDAIKKTRQLMNLIEKNCYLL